MGKDSGKILNSSMTVPVGVVGMSELGGEAASVLDSAVSERHVEERYSRQKDLTVVASSIIVPRNLALWPGYCLARPCDERRATLSSDRNLTSR